MSMFDNAVFNSTLYEALYLQIEGTLGFARDFFHSCVSSLPIENLPKTFVSLGELSFYEEIAEVFYFNEFQCLLLKTFSLILLFTLLLIFISWRVYGNRISERFMKPGIRVANFNLSSPSAINFEHKLFNNHISHNRTTKRKCIKIKTTQRAHTKNIMADKIKKFFQKKKIDAKFKLAGPGHKLAESSGSSQSSISKRDVPASKRSGLSQESKVAAEAALGRLQQKRDNPAFNTSLAAIKAQVKKELENETASSSKVPELKETELKEQTEVEIVPKNFAASGVYFKCPLISNDILPRDEWKKNIKIFLYEQLEEERGLTACLIIQSCNSNKEKVEACVETLCKYLENIVTHPDDEKYQKIRMSNRVFCERVQPIEGSMELFLAAGFEQEKLFNNEGNEDDFLVFKKENLPTVESLTTLIDALRTAEPIQLDLDRNLQVLLPSQAANKVQLPSSFYALSSEEIKREQQLRAEAIERNQMLRTKAMREKDEIREMRKYKFAIIRIRFPDGILLQGTFSVYERYNEIHEFVQENLEHSGLPFILNTPTGHKLIHEEESNKTLIDLRLVPTTMLTFAWHSSVIDDINNSPNKDVYLKPEIMVLVQEI